MSLAIIARSPKPELHRSKSNVSQQSPSHPLLRKASVSKLYSLICWRVLLLSELRVRSSSTGQSPMCERDNLPDSDGFNLTLMVWFTVRRVSVRLLAQMAHLHLSVRVVRPHGRTVRGHDTASANGKKLTNQAFALFATYRTILQT